MSIALYILLIKTTQTMERYEISLSWLMAIKNLVIIIHYMMYGEQLSNRSSSFVGWRFNVSKIKQPWDLVGFQQLKVIRQQFSMLPTLCNYVYYIIMSTTLNGQFKGKFTISNETFMRGLIF